MLHAFFPKNDGLDYDITKVSLNHHDICGEMEVNPMIIMGFTSVSPNS